MLLKFRIKNYKSYKNLQEFSMISGNTKSYEERLHREENYSVLKFSAIYGANGAGKTNIIDALSDMQAIVMIGLPSYLRPIYYKLDEQCKRQPTYFEIYLLINHKIYSYGFEYDSSINKILSEWLTLINGKKDKDIFTRDMVKRSFYFDSEYNKKTDNKLEMYLDDFKEDNTKLFLSFINSNKKSVVLERNSELKEIYEWFEDSLNITEPDSVLTSGAYFLIDEKIQKLAKLLEAFGTGIKSIKGIDVDIETATQNIPTKVIDKLKAQALEEHDGGKVSELAALLRTRTGLWNIFLKGEEISFKKICFYHDISQKIPFSINEESEGTIRLIDLAETLLTEKGNQLFVIDELDRKLHPQLTCKFVENFLENCTNNYNQLIVSTHESRLLDFSLLRRDEIWFANKEENGESKIYSLEEFNVRFDKKIDKAYLDGRYGGIPIFDTVFPIFNKNAKNSIN